MRGGHGTEMAARNKVGKALRSQEHVVSTIDGTVARSSAVGGQP